MILTSAEGEDHQTQARVPTLFRTPCEDENTLDMLYYIVRKDGGKLTSLQFVPRADALHRVPT